MKTQECVGKPIGGHNRFILCVAISPDGYRIASGSLNGTLRIWNMAGKKCVGRPLQRHTYAITSVAISEGGGILFLGPMMVHYECGILKLETAERPSRTCKRLYAMPLSC